MTGYSFDFLKEPAQKVMEEFGFDVACFTKEGECAPHLFSRELHTAARLVFFRLPGVQRLQLSGLRPDDARWEQVRAAQRGLPGQQHFATATVILHFYYCVEAAELAKAATLG
jgi:hypothetical protein